LIFNTLYYPHQVGGAEKSVQVLAEALARQGIDVTVASISEKELPSSNVNGVKTRYFQTQNLYWPFQKSRPNFFKRLIFHFVDARNYFMKKAIEMLFREEKPDVVHTNNLTGFSTIVWTVAKKNNVPIVHTLRDYYLLCVRSSMFKKDRNCIVPCLSCSLLSTLKCGPATGVTTLVGNSRFILDVHRENRNLGAIPNFQTVYNGYSPPGSRVRFDPQKERRFELSGKVIFGFLGQLSPEKGLETLINAFLNLNSGHRLLICGKGRDDYEQQLKKLYSHSIGIEFLGFQPPSQLFEKIDVLVVPSLWNEPLPRTIFESYSHGIPVIASNRGGNPEIVEVGSTGYLFEPDLQNDLYEKMNLLMNSGIKKSEFYENCIRKSLDFLPEKVVEGYRQIYLNSLGNKPVKI